MPELPEVEVICRGLHRHLLGRKITTIHHSGLDMRLQVPIDSITRHILHHEIVAVNRRAKYLIIATNTGAKMLIHLGMTGRLAFFPQETPAARHDHVRFRLDNNFDLRFNDSRRFGSILVFSGEDAANLERVFFGSAGPEPFSRGYSAKYMMRKATGRKQPVKVFLMTNEIVVGIGNIYANEILYASRISPARHAGSLNYGEWRRIVLISRRILQEAIECGGSTISDFVNANRENGYFQVNFQVYDRKGEPCRSCDRPIEKIELGGRASYFCPKCQK